MNRNRNPLIKPGHPPLLWAMLFLAASALLAACGMIPGAQVAGSSTDGTPVPTPTRDPSGYQSIESEACLVSSWNTMQVDPKLPQGDLIAWQPQMEDDGLATNIAYIAPTERTAWYNGELMLALAPSYTERIPLAPGVLATGDLTWSPSGTSLAFLAYRPNEGLFTVMTVQADGSGLTDLFPSDQARTDARTSHKAIIGWEDDQTIQVMSSCGEECRQAYDVRVTASSTPALVPTPVANYHDLSLNLQISSSVIEYQAEQFPKGMLSPNWSSDQALAAYKDKRGMLWALSVTNKTTYMIDIGLRDVYETHWSPSNRYLSVRAEDKVFVFELPCSKPR